LPDSIPARVYTKEAAREGVRLAEEIVETVGEKIR
jgi:HEPN domain-containing protein